MGNVAVFGHVFPRLVPGVDPDADRSARGCEPEAAAEGRGGMEAREIDALYREHAPRIQRFLRDLLGDAALAADATQETFVRAMRLHATFDRARPPAPWLFGIARNVSLELRKARARAGRVLTPEADAPERAASSARAPGGSPEHELLGREAVRVVGEALAELSQDRRAMLLLRLDHGLSYEAIAEAMGFSLAKVKVEIFRAREVLRAVMAEYRQGDAR